ncbi:MAG TPA: hypothetical protein VK922_07560 [Gemmatimonadaceae bacterium]|nr:hypothetical protein [Gemmatimonadaceae bacterium]
MDHDVVVFAQVMTVVMSSLAAFIVITLGARALWRMGSRQAARPLADPTVRDELQRLQTAVDAIAIEVERISETQRFTLTLLGNGLPSGGERLGQLPRGAGSRVDTPH